MLLTDVINEVPGLLDAMNSHPVAFTQQPGTMMFTQPLAGWVALDRKVLLVAYRHKAGLVCRALWSVEAPPAEPVVEAGESARPYIDEAETAAGTELGKVCRQWRADYAVPPQQGAGLVAAERVSMAAFFDAMDYPGSRGWHDEAVFAEVRQCTGRYYDLYEQALGRPGTDDDAMTPAERATLMRLRDSGVRGGGFTQWSYYYQHHGYAADMLRLPGRPARYYAGGRGLEPDRVFALRARLAGRGSGLAADLLRRVVGNISGNNGLAVHGPRPGNMQYVCPDIRLMHAPVCAADSAGVGVPGYPPVPNAMYPVYGLLASPDRDYILPRFYRLQDLAREAQYTEAFQMLLQGVVPMDIPHGRQDSLWQGTGPDGRGSDLDVSYYDAGGMAAGTGWSVAGDTALGAGSLVEFLVPLMEDYSREIIDARRRPVLLLRDPGQEQYCGGHNPHRRAHPSWILVGQHKNGSPVASLLYQPPLRTGSALAGLHRGADLIGAMACLRRGDPGTVAPMGGADMAAVRERLEAAELSLRLKIT